MTDELRRRLDDLADRTSSPSSDEALARLDRARGRRIRSRRIGALVVAAVVAIAGTGTAMLAFDQDAPERRTVGEPSAVDWEPHRVLTVWPESALSATTPDEVQAAVDAGDPDRQWRTSPEAVVQRFAGEVLGWTPKFRLWGGREDGRIRGIVSPCGGEDACSGDAGAIRLVQPSRIGSGGIWSVAAFATGPLTVGDIAGVDIGDVVHVLEGDAVPFDLDIPPGTKAHIGMVATNGCRSSIELTPDIEPGTHATRLFVPRGITASACSERAAGYVFAYVQDASTVPVGDPLLEAASFEYPWLTIHPLEIGARAPAPRTGGDETPAARPSPSLTPDGALSTLTFGGWSVELPSDWTVDPYRIETEGGTVLDGVRLGSVGVRKGQYRPDPGQVIVEISSYLGETAGPGDGVQQPPIAYRDLSWNGGGRLASHFLLDGRVWSVQVDFGDTNFVEDSTQAAAIRRLIASIRPAHET